MEIETEFKKLADLGYWIFYPWPKINWVENQIVAEGLCCPPKNVKDAECFIINTQNEKFLIDQIEFFPEPLKDTDWFFKQYISNRARRFRFIFKNDNLNNLLKSGIGISFGSKITFEPFRIEDTFFYQKNDLPVPPSENILHVSTTDSPEIFNLAGFTIFVHLDRILKEYFQKPLSNFKNICDWGCGCGRLTRFLLNLPQIRITGLDVDRTNINWCKKNLLNSTFLNIKSNPPVELKKNEFDLVIGISVFTHLKEKLQFEWLRELQRITKKNSPVIMTVNSLKAWVLTRQGDKQSLSSFLEKGIYDRIPNSQLNSLGDIEYVNSFHTHQYIKQNWSKYFEIVAIIDGGIGAYQDVVVMKKK